MLANLLIHGAVDRRLGSALHSPGGDAVDHDVQGLQGGISPDEGLGNCHHAGAYGAKGISGMSTKICCYHPGMQTVDCHLKPGGQIGWALESKSQDPPRCPRHAWQAPL